MGLFGRKKGSGGSAPNVIPAGSLNRLPEIGRTMFGDEPAYVDVSDFYLPGFIAAGSPTEDPGWSRFVDSFVADLSEAASRLGGWASPGAFHVAKDFVKSDDWSKPALAELMDTALRFLIQQNADGRSIPNFAIPRWNQLQQQ